MNLPEWQDSRRVDRRHYAMAVCGPRSWRRRIPVAMHRWSPYKRRPTHSWPSNWIRRAMCRGNRSMLWKNSALLLRLLKVGIGRKHFLFLFCLIDSDRHRHGSRTRADAIVEYVGIMKSKCTNCRHRASAFGVHDASRTWTNGFLPRLFLPSVCINYSTKLWFVCLPYQWARASIEDAVITTTAHGTLDTQTHARYHVISDCILQIAHTWHDGNSSASLAFCLDLPSRAVVFTYGVCISVCVWQMIHIRTIWHNLFIHLMFTMQFTFE